MEHRGAELCCTAVVSMGGGREFSEHLNSNDREIIFFYGLINILQH